MDTRVIVPTFVTCFFVLILGIFIGAGASRETAKLTAEAELREAMSYAQSTADDRHAFTQCLLDQWARQEERLP